MAEKTPRQANLERISVLHKALRGAAIGNCPNEFRSKTLGELEQELRVRLIFELQAVTEKPLFDPRRN